MAEQIESFEVLDAKLIHAGGSTGRLEFELPGGRVATVACDIEQKPMTGAAEKREPELFSEPKPLPPTIRELKERLDREQQEEDEILARERAAHAAEDARQTGKLVRLEVGGEVGPTSGGQSNPHPPVETEVELLAREAEAQAQAEEEARKQAEQKSGGDQEPPPSS
jgi:hypothetical protein